MAIVIAMNCAGKRACRQRMRECRTVAERVRYGIILAWAAPDPPTRAAAETGGCAVGTALRVAHRYLADGEAELWDHRAVPGPRARGRRGAPRRVVPTWWRTRRSRVW